MLWMGILIGFITGCVVWNFIIVHRANRVLLKMREEIDDLLDATEVDEFIKEKLKIVMDKF